MPNYEGLDNDLDLYERGGMLRSVVNTPTWEIIIDTLKAYKESARDELMRLLPGDPTVPTAHAATYAVEDLFFKFQQDINKAIDFASHPSEEFMQHLSGVRESSDVAKQMGIN